MTSQEAPRFGRAAGSVAVALGLLLLTASGCENDETSPSFPADVDFSGLWLDATGSPVYTLTQESSVVVGTANLTIVDVSTRFLVSGRVRATTMALSPSLPPGVELHCSGCILPDTHCRATISDGALHALEMTCVQDAHRCCGTHLEVEYELHRGGLATSTSPALWEMVSTDGSASDHFRS